MSIKNEDMSQVVIAWNIYLEMDIVSVNPQFQEKVL